jgi:hypothetical protein
MSADFQSALTSAGFQPAYLAKALMYANMSIATGGNFMTLRRNISLLFFIFASQLLHAAPKGGCIPGAYLVVEESGTQSLWTFSSDGTVQSASSAQGALNFSDAQGAWKQSRSGQAKATIIDFNYSNSSLNGGFPPSGIARVDATLSFSKKCDRVEGSFELRFFDPETEDPLDVTSDSGNPISDTFTGRRIIVKK